LSVSLVLRRGFNNSDYIILLKEIFHILILKWVNLKLIFMDDT
jgi:hypothetical protein